MSTKGHGDRPSTVVTGRTKSDGPASGLAIRAPKRFSLKSVLSRPADFTGVCWSCHGDQLITGEPPTHPLRQLSSGLRESKQARRGRININKADYFRCMKLIVSKYVMACIKHVCIQEVLPLCA
jgi:hypothetical protein